MLANRIDTIPEESLQEALHERIRLRTGGRLKWVSVEMDSDRVILHGASPSYYLLQLLLVAVREVLPKHHVDLDFQVGRDRPRPSAESSFAAQPSGC